MKLMITALMTLFTLNAFAGEMTLSCQGFYNYELILENEVKIGEFQKNIELGEIGEYKILVSSLGQNKIELLGYNFTEPSRTYTTALMNKSGDIIELAVWKREFLLEVKCTSKI